MMGSVDQILANSMLASKKEDRGDQDRQEEEDEDGGEDGVHVAAGFRSSKKAGFRTSFGTMSSSRPC